jgi:hypothetical protein
LQEFLPWQPLSLDLQPPCPLQSFLPLQECLPLHADFEAQLSFAFCICRTVFPSSSRETPTASDCSDSAPASRPAIAAPVIIDFRDFLIARCCRFLFRISPHISIITLRKRLQFHTNAF